MKLLLFDVDLTLISTGGAGIRALNRACAQVLEIQNAMDGVHPGGKTDPAIVREILRERSGVAADPATIVSILNAYLAALREEVEGTTAYRILPGVLDILDAMTGRSDVLLGLATGNLESGARIKLERGRLNRYFAFGGFASDSEERPALVAAAARKAAVVAGRAIDPKHVFVIGDTPRDVEAGRIAGFQTIAVATGAFAMDAFGGLGANLVISDLESGRKEFMQATGLA